MQCRGNLTPTRRESIHGGSKASSLMPTVGLQVIPDTALPLMHDGNCTVSRPPSIREGVIWPFDSSLTNQFLPGDGLSLGAGAHSQLGIQVVDVGLDGGGGDEQLLRHLLVA